MYEHAHVEPCLSNASTHFHRVTKSDKAPLFPSIVAARIELCMIRAPIAEHCVARCAVSLHTPTSLVATQPSAALLLPIVTNDRYSTAMKYPVAKVKTVVACIRE